MSEIFSASQIIDKDLFAKKKVAVYSLPTETSSVLYNVNAGNRVGTVYSYVVRDGIVWWQLDKGYVKHEKGRFDIKAIQAQGGKTEVELQHEAELKAESDLPFADRIFKRIDEFFKPAESVLKYAIPVAIIIIAIILGLKVYRTFKQSKYKTA